jgi:hypothetical protein
MLHVYHQRAYVASINQQAKAADGYRPDLPWLLLLSDGRARRHASAAEARDEAQKQFPGCVFKRT